MKSKIQIVTGAVETVEGAYVPHRINNAADAYRASLHMVLKHTADVFLTIVDIMAEKYSTTQDDIMDTITKHPKYKDAFVNPMLHDLGYLNPAAPAPAPAPAPASASEQRAEEPGQEEQREAAKARLKEKRKAKEISVSSSTVKNVDELMESITNMKIDAGEEVVASVPKEQTKEQTKEPKKMVVLKRKKNGEE